MTSAYFMKCILCSIFPYSDKSDPTRTYTMPTNFYIGLSTTEPDKFGNNIIEPLSTAGYSRQPIDIVSSFENPAGIPITVNKNIISFGECISDWGSITHYVIFDSSMNDDGCHLLMYGAFATPIELTLGSALTIVDGGLQIKMVNEDEL